MKMPPVREYAPSLIPSRVLSGYFTATVTRATAHALAAKYPQLEGTLTCSGHSGSTYCLI